MKIAHQRGISPAEVLQTVTLSELQSWEAFFLFEQQEYEYPFSMLASTIANHLSRPKQPYPIQHFQRWPVWPDVEEVVCKPLSPREQLEADAAAAGWTVPQEVWDQLEAEEAQAINQE